MSKNIVLPAVIAVGLLSATVLGAGLASAEGAEFEKDGGSAVSTLVQSGEDSITAGSGLVLHGEKVLSRSGVKYRDALEQSVIAEKWSDTSTLVIAKCSGEPGRVLKVRDLEGETVERWEPIGITEDIPVQRFASEIQKSVGAETKHNPTLGTDMAVRVDLPIGSAESWLPKVHDALPKCSIGEKFETSKPKEKPEKPSDGGKSYNEMSDQEREELPVWGE